MTDDTHFRLRVPAAVKEKAAKDNGRSLNSEIIARIEGSSISLRDWFAGQALAGLLANPSRDASIGGFAADAYAFADALIAAREKGGTP